MSKKKEPAGDSEKPNRLNATKKICELYETDEYTIAECCKSVGITDRTFENWRNKYSELSELFKEANERRIEKRGAVIRQKAASGLLKLIEGYASEEIQIEYDGMPDFSKPETVKVKSYKVIRKNVAPNVAACIFASRDSEYMKQSTDEAVNINPPTPVIHQNASTLIPIDEKTE